MTKRELLDLLAPFDDDHYVYVRLRSDDYPSGCQLIIQGIDVTLPWYHEDCQKVQPLIAIVVNEHNAEPEVLRFRPDEEMPEILAQKIREDYQRALRPGAAGEG